MLKSEGVEGTLLPKVQELKYLGALLVKWTAGLVQRQQSGVELDRYGEDGVQHYLVGLRSNTHEHLGSERKSSFLHRVVGPIKSSPRFTPARCSSCVSWSEESVQPPSEVNAHQRLSFCS